jgi:glutathione reductase (NADPH)
MEKATRYEYEVPKDLPFDFHKFVDKRHAKIKQLNGIYETNWAKDGIELIHARATFVSDHELEIKPNDGGDAYRITADHICIATGSYPTKPKDIEGSEHGITSDEYFSIAELPKKMAFVGAGYIAVELAGVMQALGVETHLFIRGTTFLRKFDPMVQDILTKHYEEMGVTIHKEHPGFKKVELLHPGSKDNSDPRQKELKITSKDGSELVVNELLWAIGRGAETRNLGLENTGVKLDKTGHVVVDEYQNTTAEGVYAIGDITGQAELTPVAIAAGRHLSNRLFSGKKEYSTAHLNYENVRSTALRLATCY